MFYRERLKQELERRKAKNPRYSLSALARDVGLTPAAVSLVLSGQRHFSRRTLLAVGRTLNWSESDLNEALTEINLRPRKAIDRRARRISPAHAFEIGSMSSEELSEFMDSLDRLVKSYSKIGRLADGGDHVSVVVRIFSVSRTNRDTIES